MENIVYRRIVHGDESVENRNCTLDDRAFVAEQELHDVGERDRVAQKPLALCRVRLSFLRIQVRTAGTGKYCRPDDVRSISHSTSART